MKNFDPATQIQAIDQKDLNRGVTLLLMSLPQRAETSIP